MFVARVALVHLFLPALVLAQTPQRRALAIEDYYRIRAVGGARIAPTGDWVAYTVATRVEENNSTRTETWVVGADGRTPPAKVQHNGADVSAPDWLPDGRLSYRAADGTYAIEYGKSGAVPEKFTAETGVRSPDRKWIASAQRIVVQKKASTYASDFERRHEERFKGLQFDWQNYKRDGAAAPVPDPRDPAQNPASEVFVSAADGGAPRQLTRLSLQASNLTWSDDGRIIFTANPEYRSETLYGGSDLFSVTLDGQVTRLTDDEFVYNNPRFAPNGRQFAFTRSLSTDHIIKQKLNHGGSSDLFVQDANGQRRNLTANWNLDPGAPTWSPDSKWIYFTANKGVETHLFRVAANGGNVEQVTKGSRVIVGVTFDRAFKRIAYGVGTLDQPTEVHTANIDGSDERKLTSVSAEFLREVEPSKGERVNFRSQDGTPIEGQLLYPHGYRENGGPYPLIVVNHGGPHSNVNLDYNFKNQFLAANGYFVLEVNFRSSTGYGDDFKWATWGAWGTRDGQDVIAGVDHVISRFPVDRNRVATMGHSYGGFMTNWLITQYPDRFAAAATGAGISNWISDYGMADIARTKETEFFGTPWDPQARDIMIKQSPLYYANRVRTPTLFIHGEVDYRVPYAEAEQFYFALKKNGVPAKIIMYEGQSHGIAGHWNNVHRMLNELRWFEQYLRPKA